ncbi:MAG: nuclear transport factor 2 family protein [Alphaproteobacteria bacterium]|nr:nuclear transport factor 2 family protein [Alphaproteobacteria bacterium]
MAFKRSAIFSVLSSAVFAAALSLGSAALAACPPANPAAVSATVQSMFTALAKGDVKMARTYMAPKFYLFDGGVRFDADGIFAAIQKAQQSGSTYAWNVTEPEVHFACNIAWITYVNQGGVTTAGKETPVTWLESGILRHEAGRWVILFMHSTRAPTPAQ